MATYRSLLASRTFTFLVGPDREPIDIHVNLLQSLSQPLDRLMNNGTMKESTERVAVLEEVDINTFGLFAEFCYTHNYRAPPKTAQFVDQFNNINAGSNPPESINYRQTVQRFSRYNIDDIRVDDIRDDDRIETRNNYTRLSNGNILLPLLKAKKYGAMGMSHNELRTHLENLKPKDEPSEKLVYHAKLYVFATMYMIQSLKDLCLHKLLRDLEAFDVKYDSGGDFAELFRYVYVNTSGNDDNTIGTGSELRDLVVTYAASTAEFLVRNKLFLEVLEEGGEGASAFAVFMAKRLNDFY